MPNDVRGIVAVCLEGAGCELCLCVCGCFRSSVTSGMHVGVSVSSAFF